MTPLSSGNFPLEKVLARLLFCGTWLASSAIGVGLILALFDPGIAEAASHAAIYLRLVTLGIGTLILLPVVRVAVMLLFFLRGRDYRLAFAATLVLAILFSGIVIGLHSATGKSLLNH